MIVKQFASKEPNFSIPLKRSLRAAQVECHACFGCRDCEGVCQFLLELTTLPEAILSDDMSEGLKK